jgi:tRNA threonylcarbamoyladenosine biosynthesis protein TsaE
MQQKLTLKTGDPTATEQIAELIGGRLVGGEVIELISDLGGGKTTFVRGLARGMGSNDRVASPSYTISKVYTAGKLQLHHFDFYRLDEGGMVAHELAEFISDPLCVVVVEWAEVVHQVLPADRVTISINRLSENSRSMEITYGPQHNYLMEGLA